MLAGVCTVTGDAATPPTLRVEKQHPLPPVASVAEARVRIHACCLDESDWRVARGAFPEFRRSAADAASYVPSYACSGVIDQIGGESLHFKRGDEVLVLLPLDSPYGGCAEYTVQPVLNLVAKPSSLSHEDACAVAWSGIQAFTSLHYQMHVRPGERLLLCTSHLCTDLVLSSLAGLFGAKLIVATHTQEAYALFTTPQSITLTAPTPSTETADGASDSIAFEPILTDAAATSVNGTSHKRLNPLAHVLRVVDCSASGVGARANEAVLAAVMEETGGLGVDGVIDLQDAADADADELNFMHPRVAHLVIPNRRPTQETASDVPTAPTALTGSIDTAVVSGPAHPITFATLVRCLGVQGRLITSSPNLQVDPPLMRQLHLRGGTLACLFPQNWLLGATQRGKFSHVVTEVLSLAASGLLRPSIHSRHHLSAVAGAWSTTFARGACSVGKIVITTDANIDARS